ncbi:UNVERIFIED_CONTAM: aryl-phospho-beta-D-glucosidase BglC (GH1 family) [Streptomyces graminofaciens]
MNGSLGKAKALVATALAALLASTAATNPAEATASPRPPAAGAAVTAGSGATPVPSPGPVPSSPAGVPSPGSALSSATDWTPPLSTRGRYIVDAHGNRFKLRSGNWHGASGTWTGTGDREAAANHHAGEKADRIPLGLDRAPVSEIVAGFRELGLNSVRLPFSNEMVHDRRVVADASVAANPALRGRTPLQVYDAVVAALTGAGLAVILNNHTNTTRWCCGVDGNERWNASRSDAEWEADWLFMARRYRDDPRVVGADLYNEVRRSVWDDPNWGLGDRHDWFAASQRLGDRILQEANPDLLIVVEGINWTGVPVDGLPHGRPTLEPVQRLSHTLVRSGKLVYSAHFYDYTGPHHTGATGPGETSDNRYRDFGRDELFDVLDRQAFYVAGQADRHFTAPVWISEFGIGGRDEHGEKPRAWFENFVDHLIARDADFAYWPMVGWHEDRKGNGWALLHWDSPQDGASASSTATTGVPVRGAASSPRRGARATSRPRTAGPCSARTTATTSSRCGCGPWATGTRAPARRPVPTGSDWPAWPTPATAGCAPTRRHVISGRPTARTR